MFKLLVVLITLSFTVQAESVTKLRSAVSPQYIDGLQHQFINYISEKSKLDIEISFIPFARRLEHLKQGKLDFMVGLSLREDREPFIHFIEPSYYNNPNVLFVRNDSQLNLQNVSQLKSYKIGSIIRSKLFAEYDNSSQKITVTTITQLIKMLSIGRIDGFIFNQYGGLSKVESMGYAKQIMVHPIDLPGDAREFIGISKKSSLYRDQQLLDEFKRIQKDYLRLRKSYYQQKH
ncbi:MAG: hypothetical protein OFPI_07710 [Osedax symbiont Rs2]|nr:MAG: hypothetical protein OFPI_07710 [Osedax symbiont Rs2]